jgi:DNA-binding beta-propeller fold protein YncE
MTMKHLLNLSAFLLPLLLMPIAAQADFKLKPLGVELQDSKETPLSYPEGVGCGAKGLVVAADTGNGRLVKYQIVNGEMGQGTEIRLSQILYPIKVAISPKNEILVLDGRQRKILRVSPEGAFIGNLDPQGMPGKEPYLPKAVAVDGTGLVYVLDIASARVLVLDQNGNYKQAIPLPVESGFIGDIAVDSRGTVFALDSVGLRIYKTSAESGKFAPFVSNLGEFLDFPSNIAVDLTGKVFLSDQSGSALLMFGPDGSFQGRQMAMGIKPGSLKYPAQLCIIDNTLVVADRNNSRIQILGIIR